MKLLLFDFDGVLVDSLDVYEKTVTDCLSAIGRPLALRFDALTLFESRLSHEGVSHVPIVSAPIAAAGG